MAASVMVQGTAGDELCFEELHEQEALAICSLYALLDKSIRYALHTIFGPSSDKRVKRGGNIFIAHLLRFAVLDQLSLFPGTEICDYARIVIPNILRFSRDHDWPWCYDTTLKYINLLVAAGILITRPDEPGIYYLPLGPYVLLPDHARQLIEKLAHRREKVSRSAAFRRTIQHCLTPAHTALPEFVGSPAFSREQGLQQAVAAITAVLQKQQGVTLLPKTLTEIMTILAGYVPQTLQKKEAFLQALPASLVNQDCAAPSSERCGEQDTNDVQNLPLRSDDKVESEGESTTVLENRPYSDQIVDSAHGSFTDSLMSLNYLNNLSDISEFTIDGIRRSTLHTESASCNQVADSSCAQPKRDFSDEEIEHWAHELSLFVNKNHAKVGHYRTLLRQSSVDLHIAIVDTLVRSAFPDPHRRAAKLGGGWVTNRFKAYRAGDEEVPPEIYAWSQTGLSYAKLEELLNSEVMHQETAGTRLSRPFPDEVHRVVASTEVSSLCQCDDADGLEKAGYWYVEVNGELLTGEQYEHLRKRALHVMPEADQQEDTEEKELQAFVEWYGLQRYAPGEIESLLKHLSPPVAQRLMTSVERLQEALDSDQYGVEVVVLPNEKEEETALQSRLIIEVREKREPKKAWLLRKEAEVEYFLAHLDRLLDGSEQTLSAAVRLCRMPCMFDRADKKFRYRQSTV